MPASLTNDRFETDSKSEYTARDVGPNDGFIDVAKEGIEFMQNCQKIFTSWARELDDGMMGAPKGTSLPFQSAINQLRADADAAAHATVESVKDHQRFSNFMALRLESLEKMDHASPVSDSEIEMLGEAILKRRNALKACVVKMQDDFEQLLDMLGDSRHGEKNWWKKIWAWLKRAYQAVISVVTGTLADHSAWLHNTEYRRARRDSEDSQFDAFLRSFKRDVLEQVKTVENNFLEFQVVQNVRKKDIQLQLKKLAALNRSDAATAKNRWRKASNALTLILAK